MLDFAVNEGRCTRCDECVIECPSRIIVRDGDGLPRIEPDKEALCIQCQHCMAICPPAAISIFGKRPEDSLPLSSTSFPSLDSMLRLVRGRRSIRRYKDTNVDPALIRQLLTALANVPTGVNRRELTFTVVDDKTVMQTVRRQTMETLAAAATANRIPPTFTYLQTAVSAYFEHGADVIFRGAPHLLVISAPPDAPCPREDVALALAYFELLAQSAGLGTVWCGMFKMALEILPESKTLIGLPAKHAYYTMLFGTPAIRFPRAVQRDAAAVIRRVSV
jgi:nitroreductase/Pyruvate/2-oxoacid:ferredoxin oxidoreductase delta subunit